MDPLPPDLDAAPGAALGGVLAGIDLSRVDDADLVTLIGVESRQLAHQQARLWAAIAELARRPVPAPRSWLTRRDGTPDPEQAAAQASQWAYEAAVDEVRAALVLTRRSAGYEVDHAVTLATLPRVAAALRAGRLDRRRAIVFTDTCWDLTPEQTDSLLDAVLPDAATKTATQLADTARRTAIALDPDWAARRYRAAVHDRKVTGHHTSNGTITITGTGLPADEAAVALRRVDRLASAATHAGAHATLDTLRADLLLALLDGQLSAHNDTQIITHLLDRHPPPPTTDTDDGDSSNTDSSNTDSSDGDSSDSVGSDSVATATTTTTAGTTGDTRTTAHAGTTTDPMATGNPASTTGSTANVATTGHAATTSGATATATTADATTANATTNVTTSDETCNKHNADYADEDRDADAADEDRDADAAAGDRRPPTTPPPVAPPPATTAPPPAVRDGVHIRVGLATLLGRTDEPGELPGWGPILAPTARSLVATQTRCQWRYVIHDAQGHYLHGGLLRARPDGAGINQARHPGAVVELLIPHTLLDDPTLADQHPAWARVLTELTQPPQPDPPQNPDARFPGDPLRRKIQLLMPTCVFPSCRRPSLTCDQDHHLDWAYGGQTTDTNLGPLCAHDHHNKTSRGWTLTRTAARTYHWTSPHGAHFPVTTNPIAPPLPTPIPRPLPPETFDLDISERESMTRPCARVDELVEENVITPNDDPDPPF